MRRILQNINQEMKELNNEIIVEYELRKERSVI